MKQRASLWTLAGACWEGREVPFRGNAKCLTGKNAVTDLGEAEGKGRPFTFEKGKNTKSWGAFFVKGATQSRGNAPSKKRERK